MASQRVLQWPLRFPVDCHLVHTVQDPIEVALECLLGFTMYFPKDSEGNLKDSLHGDPMDLSGVSPRERGS